MNGIFEPLILTFLGYFKISIMKSLSTNIECFNRKREEQCSLLLCGMWVVTEILRVIRIMTAVLHPPAERNPQSPIYAARWLGAAAEHKTISKAVRHFFISTPMHMNDSGKLKGSEAENFI